MDEENRGRYDRDHLRYPSDLTDEEWALIEPHLPTAKRGGNRRRADLRAVTDGFMYLLGAGCQWRALSKLFQPRGTVHGSFKLWQYYGILHNLHHLLYMECRDATEREVSPTAAIIDSQSVKNAEKGGPD